MPFTTSEDVAREWLQAGKTVIARQLLSSSNGKGIVVIDDAAGFVSAPVYTQYIPKKHEYRVHIFRDNVVDVLEKRKKKGFVGSGTKIRNTTYGYVFCRQQVEVPPGLVELALAARKVNNSDFCGVDIGYNVKNNCLFVIEVNSAPGMENTTVDNYVEAICK